jgi:glycosyltransferase involved in cell wall biosynthesis
MAVYNGMPYLEEAVDSVLKQTYKNFEFIIVNDASTDKSWKFLKSIKDKRLVLLQNKKNMGLANSLNKALRLSRGDFIARMDADDISLPKRLEIQLNFMTKNPNIDLCGTWVDKINAEGEKVGETKYPQKDKSIKKLLAWKPSIVHPTFFAKVKFFKQLGNYDPRFDYAEEYELLMRAGDRFKMANIPQKLLKWRLWDKRRSRLSWEKMEKVDFEIKRLAYKRGDFGKHYIIVLGAKYFIAYILPYNLKLRIFNVLKIT